jgi:ribosome-associated toxin RatA of RatAB toxin-antitoxin module
MANAWSVIATMDTSITRHVRTDPRTIFALAAAVEDWPRILPHYRWVRVLASGSDGLRTVEMAARRDVVFGAGLPLRWTAIQRLLPESGRIEFRHVAGVSRGMQVAWTFEQNEPGVTEVSIRHLFEPRWPAPEVLVRAVVGEYFVNGVARRTLRRIGELAEARTHLANPEAEEA